MTLTIKRVLPAVVAFGLAGCGTTLEFDVPDSKRFADCFADPRKSFTEDTQPQTVHPFLEKAGGKLDNMRSSGKLFVINDKVPSKATEITTDTTMANSIISSGRLKASSNEAEKKADNDAIIALIKLGNEVWNHPVHQTVLRTFNALAGDLKSTSISLSVGDIRDYQRISRQFAGQGGWRVYGLAAYHENNAFANTKDEKIVQLLNDQKFANALFVDAYLRAYFRNGEFVQGKWDLGNPFREALKRLTPEQKAKFEKLVPSELLDKVDQLLKDVYKGEIGKVADAGFVTRGGDAMAVPPLAVSLDLSGSKKRVSVSEFDAAGVGGDLTRVTLEALGDAFNGIPAVSNATGVTDKGLVEGGVRLANFAKVKMKADAGKDGKEMNPDYFAEIESLGGKSHSMTSSAAGAAVRGLNIASLNNEALAKIIEATVGTIVRKVTERGSWCWFASLDSTEATRPLSLTVQPLISHKVAITFTYF